MLRKQNTIKTERLYIGKTDVESLSSYVRGN